MSRQSLRENIRKLREVINMKIEKIPENSTGKGGKSELGSSEKWLFDTEEGNMRLKSLIEMDMGNQATAELKEFEFYGSKAGTSNGLAISLNRVFIIGKIPLKAMGRKDKVVIKKLAKFKIDEYGKADKIPMGANHIDTVNANLKALIQSSEWEKVGGKWVMKKEMNS